MMDYMNIHVINNNNNSTKNNSCYKLFSLAEMFPMVMDWGFIIVLTSQLGHISSCSLPIAAALHICVSCSSGDLAQSNEWKTIT